MAAPAVALSTDKFRKSDRLLAALTGSSKSIGASCNTFRVGDSIDSIAEAVSWSLQVSAYQGAPSVDLSDIRPRNSTISSGGTTSGAASFGAVIDAAIGSMRRDTKKNGAGAIWLNWNHPDLPEFLATNYRFAYRGVYIPGNHEPVEQALFLASPIAHQLVQAYDDGKCFLCKRPPNNLLRNLCTEVTIPHRGTCVLGVINLSQFTPSNVEELPTTFVNAALEMANDSNTSRNLQALSPLWCRDPDNVQFGLGVSGLASTLANWGITYAEFNNCLLEVRPERKEAPIYEWEAQAADAVRKYGNKPAFVLIYNLVLAYSRATSTLNGRVRKAFCIQPSATGAYACADASGYVSSPELQPVVGLRDESGVHTIRKSALLGDQKVVFHPNTDTVHDVPFEVYASVCSLWQELMNSTSLAHSHSGCWYGKEFGKSDLVSFVDSARECLYYRLPDYNPLALNKSKVGEGLAAADDFDLDALLNGASLPACGLKQEPGAIECDCAG